MTPDDQYSIDFAEIDTHEPVTEENVMRILHILNVPPIYQPAYEQCVTFLEPLPWECEIIEKVVMDWCKQKDEIEQIKKDWCGE